MEYAKARHIGDILKERNIEIIGADPVTRHGFTQVPNFILTKKDISVGAKLAYAMLLKYAWADDACYPGQVKLAEDMGSGERSIRTYLKELEDEKMAMLIAEKPMLLISEGASPPPTFAPRSIIYSDGENLFPLIRKILER